MFKYFDDENFLKNRNDWRFFHYEIEEDCPLLLLADFLKEFDNISYDRKKAVIHSSTKNGEIYSIKEINEFNRKYGHYLEICGVGNEVGAMTHDPGCAVVEFQVNINTYYKEVNHLGYDPNFKEEEKVIDLSFLESIFKKSKK